MHFYVCTNPVVQVHCKSHGDDDGHGHGDNGNGDCCVVVSGFPRLLESPGFLFVKFPGAGKYGKMGSVLESSGNFSERSWKVPEFSRL